MDMTEAELNESLASAVRFRRPGRLAAPDFETPPPTAVRDLTSTTRVAGGQGSGMTEQAGAVSASPLLVDHVPVRSAPASVSHQVEQADHHAGRGRAPTIKLSSYNSSMPLETHLAKLDICADYYSWSSRDRLCHLKASLDGHAGQVLWELSPGSTEADVIKLLRNRFGNVNQMERFRAELRSRRRKRGESVQAVYQDIRRLLALGYPGHSGELCEIVGRDAFLEALADPVLRVRVLDQQPTTLDDALAIVCRMEAYSGVAISGDCGSDDGDRKRVRAVEGGGLSVGQETPASGRIQQLERDLAEQRREINQLRNDAARATAAAAAAASTPRPETVTYSSWQAQPTT